MVLKNTGVGVHTRCEVLCLGKVRCLDFARSIDEALEFSEGVAPIDGRSAATMRRWKWNLVLAGTTYHGRSFLPAAHSSWKLRCEAEGDV